jgi:hypothetical protein
MREYDKIREKVLGKMRLCPLNCKGQIYVHTSDASNDCVSTE